MGPNDLQRTSYTVECFLNALRMNDGRDRTKVEEWLVRQMSSDANREGYAIYHRGNIYCHSRRGRVVQSLSLPEVTQSRTLWCNSKKLSAIDGSAYANNGALVMLGTTGLILSMPGTGDASGMAQKKERSSNNNNNNNNNNNG
jgi:hypothetical protein